MSIKIVLTLIFFSYGLFLFQGDYISHPVLYELSHKYGLSTDDLSDSLLPYKLEELKEIVRKEIRKELKIKEGAEKLSRVATDRKSLSHVATIVKNSNSKLAELKYELSELESQIILSQGQNAPTTQPINGSKYILVSGIWNFFIRKIDKKITQLIFIFDVQKHCSHFCLT